MKLNTVITNEQSNVMNDYGFPMPKVKQYKEWYKTFDPTLSESLYNMRLVERYSFTEGDIARKAASKLFDATIGQRVIKTVCEYSYVLQLCELTKERYRNFDKIYQYLKNNKFSFMAIEVLKYEI